MSFSQIRPKTREHIQFPVDCFSPICDNILMLNMLRKSSAPIIGGADPIVSVIKASSVRKAEADKRLRYYADEQADETMNLIRRRFSEGDAFRVFSLNIVKKIVAKLANLYRLPPRRVFDGMDQLQVEAISRALNAAVSPQGIGKP